VGDFEVLTLVSMESTLKYHSFIFGALTNCYQVAVGQCMVGSLTGAVASQKVTEAYKGKLVWNRHPYFEYNSISLPDCKTDKSSRDESRL